MVRKAAYTVTIVLLCVAVSVFRPPIVLAQPRTWVVDDDGPADFQRIQEALNAANSGDTVFVKAGTYYERLFLSKPISLLGENKDNTIVDGNSYGTLIDVNSNNVTISGFTLRNAGKLWPEPRHFNTPECAVWVYSRDFINITDNIITGSAVGVFAGYGNNVVILNNHVSESEVAGIILYASTQCEVYDNVILSYKIMGVHLDHYTSNCFVANNSIVDSSAGIALSLELGSTGNVFEGNLLANNSGGFFLYESGMGNIFRGNNVTRNRYNFGVWGFSLSSFMQDIDTSNTVDNKPIFYMTNRHHDLITSTDPDIPGYLALVNSSDITVEGLTFSNNLNGILLAQATNCTIRNLNLSRNHEGMLLFNSSNNVILNNWFDNNSVAAIVYSSNQNIFYHNDFLLNTRQILAQYLSGTDQPFGPSGLSTNKWDNGSEGNFWSNYNGTDSNKDGIGDSSYFIDANNQDKYPLMEAWNTRPSQIISPTTFIVIAAAVTITVSLGFTIYLVKSRNRWIKR